MKASLIIPSLLVSLIIPVVALSSSTVYSDVPVNHIYAGPVMHFTDTGLVSGYDAGNFGVDNEINRVEALKVIMEYWEVQDPSENVEMTFTDLEEEAWYLESLEKALSLGIVSGYPDGSFQPESSVNRVEALKMILISGGMDIPSSDDEYWYAGYLDYAIENGLLTSTADADYDPEATLTRGEFIDLLYRLEKNPYTGEDEYGVASYYGYSFDGRNTASGIPLEAYGYMAAHKTLPFGTWVRATNLDNNEYVDVEIVDRGPFIEGRIIDLTPGAFEEIGSLGSGILNVRIEILSTEE
ncbi:MAG: hypothetical protein ACI9QC_000029 [Oceanicoccus sp.]|jgi:hypothetical protein